MERKFVILALFLCIVFLACHDSTPCPENFNIVELRPNGVTFEANHAVSGDDPSHYKNQDIHLSLYNESDTLIAEQMISPYTEKPRIDYNFCDTNFRSFFIRESSESKYSHQKGYPYDKTSGKSDLISLMLPQDIAAGLQPVALAIDEKHNFVYMANWGSNNATKIAMVASISSRGQTPETTTIDVGINPSALAINPDSNKIYVTNSGSSNTISVIDGATNSRQDVIVGHWPCALAVHLPLNRIYVVNPWDNSVSVIDGSTDQVLSTISVGDGPSALAINSTTNTIYVANILGNSVTLIDGTTNATTDIPVGTNPIAIAVNEQTNKVYVANRGSNNVTIIDGRTNQTSTLTNKIYVANTESDTVSVIDGISLAVSNIAVALPANTEGDYYPAIMLKSPSL